MSEETKTLHRKFAVDCFNGTWDLMDKTDRTPADDARMVHMAHASRFHWGEIGTPLNFARGDWQLSRVYALLGQGENALRFGKSSLHLCQENNIGDFDLAFAYEAITRAFALLGDVENTEKHHGFAKQAGDAIEKKDDRDYFFSELNSIQ